MRYCVRCLYPENHPLGLTFDAQGVCSGCRVHEEKDILDWNERLERLQDIVKPYRSTLRRIHDCIVPVSGARDSHFIVHVVKHVLNMHPLLVTYNKQYNTRIGIRNLAHLCTKLGCDCMTQTVDTRLARRVTAATVRLRGSMYWHCLAGQTVFPVQVAAKLKIPLIIWGAHQGCDQVGMFSHLDEVEMTRKYRAEHDIMGLEAEDLARAGVGLSDADLEPYRYPHDKELAAVGVRGIYLNNYIRWDSIAQHQLMIETYDYRTLQQQRTFDPYNDVDCFHYSGLHDYIKFLKWGYGKVTDHACREIRLRRLTREEGAEMVRKYQNLQPNDVRLFLEWVGMKEEEFWNHINQYRDRSIWQRRSDGSWHLIDSVLHHLNDSGTQDARIRLPRLQPTFPENPQPWSTKEDQYMLYGRGWGENYSGK